MPEATSDKKHRPADGDTPQFNRDDATAHLTRLFQRCEQEAPGTKFEIRCIHPKRAPQTQLFDCEKDVSSSVAFAGEQNREGYNCYVCVNPLKHTLSSGSAKASDVEGSFFVFVDLDDEGAWEQYEGRDDRTEAFIVHTGRHPHVRAHVYWELDCFCTDMDKRTKLQKRLAATYDGDRVVSDAPRIMRLAGSVAHPSKEGRVPELVTYKNGTESRLSFDDLLGRCIPEPEESVDRNQDTGDKNLPLTQIAPPGERMRPSRDEADKILSYIDPDCCYRDWLTTLMGIHHAFSGDKTGLAIANEWSARGQEYKRGEVDHKWRSFNPNRGVTWASVCRLAKDNGANLTAIMPDYASTGTPMPTAVRLSELEEKTLPRGILSVAGKSGELLCEGTLAILAGEGGIAKSALVTSLTWDLAATTPGVAETDAPATACNGLFELPTGGGPVLLVDYEEHPAKLYRKFAMLSQARAQAKGDGHLTELPVYVLSMTGHPLYGPHPVDGSRYNAAPVPLSGWQALRNTIEDINPRLVVIDPVAAAFAGDSNAAAQVRGFLGELSLLAEEHHTGVLLVAHSTKAVRGQKQDFYDPGKVAGSSHWTDGVRGVLTLQWLPGGASGERCLAIPKSNWGPSRIWAKVEPVQAENGQIVGIDGGESIIWNTGDPESNHGSKTRTPKLDHRGMPAFEDL